MWTTPSPPGPWAQLKSRKARAATAVRAAASIASLGGPSVITHQVDEAAAPELLALESPVGPSRDAQQRLLVAISEGADQASPRRELLQERLGHRAGGGRHHDGVVGGLGRAIPVTRRPETPRTLVTPSASSAERARFARRGIRSTEITRSASRERIAAW